MAHEDPQAPATKQDIRMIMNEIGRLYDATASWKDEILDHMQTWKHEIAYEFYLHAELIRDDFLGAHKDRIENIDTRVVRIEEALGMK